MVVSGLLLISILLHRTMRYKVGSVLPILNSTFLALLGRTTDTLSWSSRRYLQMILLDAIWSSREWCRWKGNQQKIPLIYGNHSWKSPAAAAGDPGSRSYPSTEYLVESLLAISAILRGVSSPFHFIIDSEFNPIQPQRLSLSTQIPQPTMFNTATDETVCLLCLNLPSGWTISPRCDPNGPHPKALAKSSVVNVGFQQAVL